MAGALRVLVLGGTTEAGMLARALRGDDRFDVTLSLAGVTRAPRIDPGVATRVGGFGGAEGLAEWLRVQRIEAVVDATHPFAMRIGRNAVLACVSQGVALLRVARPAWQPVAGDRWTMFPDMTAAAAALGTDPRRVLLTIGVKDLAPFREHPQHDYIVRSVDAPPSDRLPPRCALITARGPFALDDEMTLLSHHRVEVIVTKNSGGEATAAKLEAARMLGLDVLMVDRPHAQGETSPRVADWQHALTWLEQCHQRAVTRRSV